MTRRKAENQNRFFKRWLVFLSEMQTVSDRKKGMILRDTKSIE